MEEAWAAVAAAITRAFPASLSALTYPLSLAFLVLFLRWSSNVFLSAAIHRGAAQLTWTPPEPRPISPAPSPDDATLCYQDLKSITYGLWRWRAGLKADPQECCSCLICLEDIADHDEVRELPCDHLFHRDCLEDWSARGRSTCPLCRRPLQTAAAAASAANETQQYDSSELVLLGCVSAFQSEDSWMD